MDFDAHFDKDEYPELNRKFFLPLRESGKMSADPSGWTDTYTSVEEHYPEFTHEIQKYYSDFYNQLNPIKTKLLPLFSAWDDIQLTPENITLCHSATVGSAIVLAFLISKGIKNIILETPCYFATYYQAETFGLNIIRIPTFHDQNYTLEIKQEYIKKYSPCAVFLTQPRTALGINQDSRTLQKLSEVLGDNNYTIIDEATEQLFPSVLSNFNFNTYENVIKIRSVFKGMGVNGVRLAYIIHHNKHRKQMAEEMEVMQGALDINSLKLSVGISSDIPKFQRLLSAANSQVLALHRKASSRVAGTPCKLSDISNGYIGSVAVNLQSEGKRMDFIKYCAEMKMPIIIGSSMGFAKHIGVEFIRLNYFNRERHILEGLEIMSSFK
jgi:histidinol-phosphate/aromatic aminotransferase/cobyric acid decarboxylase-like protein